MAIISSILIVFGKMNRLLRFMQILDYKNRLVLANANPELKIMPMG